MINDKLYVMRKNKKSSKHIIITIIIGFIWILFNESGIVTWTQLKIQQKQLEKELIALQNDEQKKIHHIEKLENDIDYIEFIAYSKYKMVKKGEKIFRVRDRKKISN